MKILGLPPDIGTPGQLSEVGQKLPIGPCGQYRVVYPLKYLNKMHSVQADWGAYSIEYVWEFARDFDIILTHRQSMPQMKAFVDHCQKMLSKKIVIDVDDELFHLEPDNPAYIWWGGDRNKAWQLFCKLKAMPGADPRLEEITPQALWHLIDVNRSNYEWMLNHADLVTVTTGYLRERISRYNENVAVCPNAVDLDDWQNISPKWIPGTEGKFILGFAGSDSHVGDLKSVSLAICRVLRKFKGDVVLALVGLSAGIEVFHEDVREWIYMVPWSSLAEYKGWLASFDVGLAPAQKNPTNLAKSGIRIYELALAKQNGVAVVASPWPYVDDVHHGMGTIAPNDAKFEKALLRYIRDDALRAEHSLRLREHVIENHTMTIGAEKWMNAYSNL